MENSFSTTVPVEQLTKAGILFIIVIPINGIVINIIAVVTVIIHSHKRKYHNGYSGE